MDGPESPRPSPVWSVWKRTQKNHYFGPKMAIFDIFFRQDIMLGGQKTVKNFGESISDTLITVSLMCVHIQKVV